jgi:hypothetical protein
MDARLLNKWIDIQIDRTDKNLYQNGQYKKASSIVMLTSLPHNTNTSVLVKVGAEQTHLHFPLLNLISQLTTEHPPLVQSENALICLPW